MADQKRAADAICVVKFGLPFKATHWETTIARHSYPAEMYRPEWDGFTSGDERWNDWACYMRDTYHAHGKYFNLTALINPESAYSIDQYMTVSSITCEQQ